MKSTVTLALFAAAVGTLTAGCSAESSSPESVEQTRAAVVGTDTFLYFRSNATGWGVDENTRLLPFATSNVFARAVNVSASWMVTSGDNAIVTETNQLDGWGSTQAYSAPAAPLVEPATAPLASASSGSTFTVKYQAIGLQRVLVNTGNSPATITVEPITCPICPGPTHCVIQANSMPTCAQ